MALVTVTMYRIVCDRCGACAQDDSDFYAWADDARALDDASDADWLITDDGKHYCADCIEWNESEDELIPKTEAPR